MPTTQLGPLDVAELVRENARRQASIFEAYNPVTGEGSALERRAVALTGSGEPGDTWHVPATMWDDERLGPLLALVDELGTLAAVAAAIEEPYDAVYAAFKDARLTHDFEFWCAVCITIETKQHGHQPFVLNRPQRHVLLPVLERQRVAGEPIRVILLKARQWGGSTCIQLYMMWIQQRHKRNWNSFVCAQDKGAATRIRGMYRLAAEKYPEDVGRVTFTPYEGSSNTKWLPERECILGVASVQNPDAVRSYTYQMLHLSEVGLWKSTAVVNAESFAQALSGALVRAPYTFCCLESTAKGVGNFFHRSWQTATNPDLEEHERGYAPVFVAWFQCEEYTAHVADVEAFARSMSDYEWELWHLGASLQQIQWYRLRKQEPGMDEEWRMKSEYPSTADEAFQSSGSRYFPKRYVNRLRETVETPVEVGDLHAYASKGPDALRGIEFVPSARGALAVWVRPGAQGIERPGYVYRNRYAIFGDVGGTTERADYSALVVVDRIFQIWHGKPEVVAVWRGHLDQDLWAWRAARLATWYQNALLAIENNSLKKDTGDETRGFEDSHTVTVLHAIRDHYSNLFYSVQPGKDHDRYDGKLGFNTNRATKPLILDTLKGAARDRLYVERNRQTCAEMDYYEVKPDGSYGAVEGQNDDLVMTTAGAVWLALEHMDPCVEVPVRSRSTERRVGVAEF